MRFEKLFFIIVGTIGIIVSVLIMLESLKTSSYCLVGSSCTTVFQSQYAYLFGIPLWLLALLGFTFYTLLGFLYYIGIKESLFIIFIGSICSSILTTYLINVEINILHAICSYCSILHLIIFSSLAYSAYLLFKPLHI